MFVKSQNLQNIQKLENFKTYKNYLLENFLMIRKSKFCEILKNMKNSHIIKKDKSENLE